MSAKCTSDKFRSYFKRGNAVQDTYQSTVPTDSARPLGRKLLAPKTPKPEQVEHGLREEPSDTSSMPGDVKRDG